MGLKILQFGRSGQIGLELLLRAVRRGHDVAALGRDSIDLAQPNRVRQAVAAAGSIDIIINGAAYTAVDKAESDADTAYKVNAESVAVLADACRQRGVPLIHLSTDYVFDGRKEGAYLEDDATAPINVYGRTKLAGEEAVRERLSDHIILRTSWVYSSHGTNFVRTMLRLGAERDELRIVDDQFGAPTAAGDIADACLLLAERLTTRDRSPCWGTYHFTCAGETTWFRFAQAIFEQSTDWLGRRPRLIPIESSQYPTPAKRPHNSRLDCSKIRGAFGLAPRPWPAALGEVLLELKQLKESGH